MNYTNLINFRMGLEMNYTNLIDLNGSGNVARCLAPNRVGIIEVHVHLGPTDAACTE